MLRTTFCAAAAALFAGTALADSQFSLSEVFVNPPGADNGQEGIEIRGPASTAMTGYKLLIIEGDGTGGGLVDVVLDLGAFSTGTNGLFLWRDAAGTVLPAPDPATTVNVADFNPDVENGSNTYVLGFGTAPSTATDLDTDNDGVIDVPLAGFGFTVVDAMSIIENDGAANIGYAADLGFSDAMLGPFNGPVPLAHTPDVAIRIYNANGPCSWAEGDVTGTNPGGPYTVSIGGEASGWDEQGIASAVVTLGSDNPAGVDTDGDGITDHCDGCPNDPSKGAPGSCGCGVAEGCSLGIDIDAISATTGGTQVLSLHGGAPFANFGYLILGSASGTVPGLQVKPTVHLDLNVDFYFNLLASAPNTLIVSSLGTLDGSGEATANWTIPGNVIALGSPVTLDHAYLIFNPANSGIVFASNTTPLTVNP